MTSKLKVNTERLQEIIKEIAVDLDNPYCVSGAVCLLESGGKQVILTVTRDEDDFIDEVIDNSPLEIDTSESKRNLPVEEYAKQVIASASTCWISELISNFDGYDFNIFRDSKNCNWYIQVNPEGQGFVYDGWWNDSEGKAVFEAVIEAITGADILNTDEDFI